MSDTAATTPATSNEAQAQPVAPQDAPPASQSPSEAIVTKDGVPLTAAASIEDLLRADPIPPAKPVITVPGDSGQSVASLTNGAPTQGQREAEEAAAAAPEPETAAPATEREPVAAAEPADAAEPPPAIDEDATIARLTQQKLDLLRTQGRKNQELGDLRQQVRALEERMQQAPPPVAAPAWQPAPAQMDPATLAAQLLDNPAAVIPALVEPLVMRRAQEIAQQVLAQQAQAWQEQQAYEQSAIAPEVGKDLFLTRHGIKQDFETWCTTDEGKAVNSLFERDANRARLLSAYRDDGDPRGIADTLSNALQAHRIGKKAAQGRQTIAQERARIEAAHPPSAPVRPATPPQSMPRAKDLYSKDFGMDDLMEFMKGAQQFDRDA